MARWGLLAGGPSSEFPLMFDAYAGVDGGAVKLLEQGVTLDLAVGDFDSIDDSQLAQIKDQAKRVVTASAEKDDTDLEMGLKAIFDQDPEAHVTVYGALGGRLDHSLSSVFLPSHPDLTAYLRQIQVVDSQNVVTYYPQGEQTVPPLSGYDYVAFMLEGQGQLTIAGAKYEMDPSTYFNRKVYGSNEFKDQPIQVTVPDGYLVVIYSKD